MDLILLAAGASRRFGGRKLFADIFGKAMYKHMADIYMEAYDFDKKIIVSGESEILDFYSRLQFIPVYNPDWELGKSHSIRLALEELKEKLEYTDESCETRVLSSDKKNEGMMFAVCDQPLLRSGTVRKMIKGYQSSDCSIVSIRCNDRMGNPCIFSYRWYNELAALGRDEGGKKIIRAHLGDVFFSDIEDERELMDIDTCEAYEDIVKMLSQNRNTSKT